ncbi:MAG: hypothetical protein V7746_19355 [Halioglobus sp.]
MKIPTYQFVAQMGAAFAVVFSLALVVYEIRENNKIVFLQEVTGSWSGWSELAMAEVESDISRELAKAMTNADELTLAEKIKLSSWLEANVSLLLLDYDAERQTASYYTPSLEAIVQVVPFYFGNEFTRGWYLENKDTFYPEIVRAIDEKLLSTPLGSDIEYYARIDSHFIE